jgi:hypothetical protein
MRLILLLYACLAITSTVHAFDKDGKGFDFYVHWAGMCNMALNEVEASKEAGELLEKDPVAAQFIARFWRHRAMQACQEYRLELIKSTADKSVEKGAYKDPELKEKLVNELQDEMSFVLMAYYFDHYVEIKSMISMRLQMARDGTSHTLKK